MAMETHQASLCMHALDETNSKLLGVAGLPYGTEISVLNIDYGGCIGIQYIQLAMCRNTFSSELHFYLPEYVASQLQM